MVTKQMSRTAEALLHASLTAGLVSPPSKDEPGFDLEQAYIVADKLRRAWVERGRRMVGRKLGFTNTTIWPELGLSEPIWAPIYNATVHFQDGEILRHSLAGAVGPCVEVEVVVKLAEVAPIVIEWAALGYEIVQCHFPNWEFNCADAVADFGLHRALFVGETSSEVNWLNALELALTRNGELVARGEAKNVLGGPSHALEWLVEIIEQSGAPHLEPGEIVTTGALTGAHPLTAGERWTTEVTAGPSLPGPVLEIEN